jgi:multiple sugar transport system substrate-binding protein
VFKARRAACAAISISSVVALASCGGGSSSGDGTTTNGKTQLTWQMWASGNAEVNNWKSVAKAVTTKNPGITVKLETLPFNDYFTKLGTQISGGSAPCIVSMQSLRLGSYSSGMLPLDDLIKKYKLDVADFDESIMQGLSAGGKQYALPYDVGSVVVIYNRDRFRQAGLPEPKPGWTMAEFLNDARALTKDGKYGFSAYPNDILMLPLIKSFAGANAVGADGKLTLTDPKFVAGFDWYASLVHKDKVSAPIPGVDPSFQETQFQSGNAAMQTNGPWALLTLKDQAKFRFGIAPLPAGPNGSATYSAGSGFGIAKSCKSPDAAFKAIMSMTSADQLRELGAAGRAYPARRSVQQAWYENAKIPGAREALEAANETAQPLRLSSNWEQVSQLLQQQGVQVFNGQAGAKDILGQIQSQAG